MARGEGKKNKRQALAKAKSDSRPTETKTEQSTDMSRAEMVGKAIERFEAGLTATGMKMTVGDFIRLLQLQKELEKDRPREIKVTWVEPSETESVTKT